MLKTRSNLTSRQSWAFQFCVDKLLILFKWVCIVFYHLDLKWPCLTQAVIDLKNICVAWHGTLPSLLIVPSWNWRTSINFQIQKGTQLFILCSFKKYLLNSYWSWDEIGTELSNFSAELTVCQMTDIKLMNTKIYLCLYNISNHDIAMRKVSWMKRIVRHRMPAERLA